MARHNRGRLFSSRGKGPGNSLLRRIIISAAAVVVIITVALVVGYYQLLAYLQGDAFRTRVADTLRTATGARQVEIAGNFSVKGNRIANEGITLTGVAPVEQARATGISAELNRTALISRKLHLYKLSMEEASLSINTDGAGQAALQLPEKATGKSRKKSTSKKKKRQSNTTRGDQKLKSTDLELELFECRDTNLQLTRSGRSYQLFNANLTATPAPKVGTDAWQFNIESARFHSPFSYLRDSSVKSATLIYNNHGIDLTDCSIMLTPGELRSKAHYDLRDSTWTTDLQVNKGNVHRIISEDWQKRLHGELYGRLLLKGNGDSVSSGTGSISVQNGVLEGLPFLSQLPVGNTYPYRSIELEKAECQILFPFNSDKINNAWLFDKINIQAKDGSLIVHGHVLVGTDRRLSGTLTIGLPRQLLGSALVAHEAVAARLFTGHGEEPGYVWVNMNLSGTIDHPEEDLSVRIATLAGQNLGQILQAIPGGDAGALLNALLRQTARDEEPASPDTAPRKNNLPGSIINSATDVLRSLF